MGSLTWTLARTPSFHPGWRLGRHGGLLQAAENEGDPQEHRSPPEQAQEEGARPRGNARSAVPRMDLQREGSRAVPRRQEGHSQGGNGGVNPSGNKPIEPEPTALTSLVQLPSKYRKETDKKDPLAWANLDQVSEKPAQDLVHNTMTDDIAEGQKHDLHTPKDNSWDNSAILGGEQKRIDQSERRRLIQENYDNEDGELIQELP